MDGFEHYLAAAFLAKKVPITVVVDRDQADYVGYRNLEGKRRGNQ
jgi:hypothetical protein